MGISGIGIWQLLIILAIVIVLFGSKRLRGLGSDLGAAIKGFRTSMGDKDAGKDDSGAAGDSMGAAGGATGDTTQHRADPGQTQLNEDASKRD